jgi:hypothetical protein
MADTVPNRVSHALPDVRPTLDPHLAEPERFVLPRCSPRHPRLFA